MRSDKDADAGTPRHSGGPPRLPGPSLTACARPPARPDLEVSVTLRTSPHLLILVEQPNEAVTPVEDHAGHSITGDLMEKAW